MACIDLLALFFLPALLLELRILAFRGGIGWAAIPGVGKRAGKRNCDGTPDFK
jgi:hypothetical protein